MGKKPVVFMVGQEFNRWEFGDGAAVIYRDPTSRELVNYKNSTRTRRQGKDFIFKAAEQQLALADAIIVDLEGIGYPDPEGKKKVLDKDTKPADMAHLKVEGEPPPNWKAVVPANLKFQLIESILGGMEEEEKN